MEGVFPRLTLITGGARSGKSAFAERLVRHAGLPLRYIATAQAFDDEMAARIAQHRHERGTGWQTIEAPLDLGPSLAAGGGAVTLLDCATLWLSNQMMAERDLAMSGAGLVADLRAAPGPVVVVTNELGWGIVPENAMARAFRDAQGRLNQQLAGAADLAVAVMAGLPLLLKGRLPRGFAP